MATDTHIKNFTAADIEKYHNGQLSAVEMNEMEKAALDDPFLADALEGYALPGLNVQTDIAELKKRLAAKTEQSKVVTLYPPGEQKFRWWKVAAAVVVIGTAAVITSQFLSKEKKSDELATVTKEKDETKSGADVETGVTVKPTEASTSGSVSAAEGANTTADRKVKSPASANDIDGDGVRDEIETAESVDAASKDNKPVPGTQAPVTSTVKSSSEVMNTEKEEAKRELAKAENNKSKDLGYSDIEEERKKMTAPAAPAKKAEDVASKNRNQVMPHIFRGRVTDASNTGVPFAKVYNPADNNAGTYTDANGYFSLTYPDSSLTVQVKAIGFENTNVQLQNTKLSNRIVMPDDRSLSEVVVSRQMPNTASRQANNTAINRKLEEPEPADGWAKYDAYLANNLEAPEETKATEQNITGAVLVSFEVDKNGEPVNITVEKSLCPKCDKEAIRLVKDGPKWKRSANKHGRTTVTINF